MRLVLSCLLAVSVAAVAPSAPPDADRSSPPPFTLAVMRRDGVMIPFAQYDGRRWRNEWPTPFTRTDVPISLPSVPNGWWGKVPPTAAWTLWRAGIVSGPVTITAPRLFTTHCVANIGLDTDYRSPEPVPPPFVHHHPKDGLVVTGDLQLEPIEALRDDMPEWTSILGVLPPYVDALEHEGERKWAWAGTGVFFNRKRRAEITLALEVLCRTAGLAPGTHVHYFEAQRRYPIPPRRGRDAKEFIALSQGFLLPGRPPNAPLDTGQFTGSLVDPIDADYLQPLGAFRFDGRLFWAVQWSGSGRERYDVIEIGEKKATQVISVAGGGC